MSETKTLTGGSQTDVINHALTPGWIKALLVSWQARQERRAAIATLKSLDDRMLKDIGIDRSEITSIVNESGRTRRPRG
jgi:uncharacterized protein YjiS (DUF1127 family)